MTSLAEPWFERWPELLAWELRRFEQLGLPATVNEDARAIGALVVTTELPYLDEPLRLEIVYPSEYPELPPVVFGPLGLLPRHQHVFGGNFCLLPRPLDDWPAQEWGAADLVADRLTALLADSEAGPEQVRAHEAPMPEPVSSYFVHARDAAVIIPEAGAPQGVQGSLTVRRSTPHLFVVESADGAAADERTVSTFPAGERLDVPYKRIESAPPVGPDGPAVARWIRREHPQLLSKTLPPKLLQQNHRLPRPPVTEMCALVFAEEGPGVGEQRDAWLFVLVDRSQGRPQEHLIHAELFSSQERARRLPDLDGLEQRRVVVLGLGTLGGDVGIELAKAGVGELDLVDCDRFEAGNTVRHRLGLEYVGQRKTEAMVIAVRRTNPACLARGHEVRFGDVGWAPEQSPLERVATLIEEADLVIDATGSHQITQFVARLTDEAGVPLIVPWLTDGFWGGELVRIAPGKTCCWTCFSRQQREGEVLVAEAGPSSDVVVQGCSHPTTSGAGFDAVELAANAARLAVQTLAPAGDYPDVDWDHAVMNFRRPPWDAQHPRFAAEPLSRVEECERCRTAAGATVAP